jgi:acyl-ACP thioesterase
LEGAVYRACIKISTTTITAKSSGAVIDAFRSFCQDRIMDEKSVKPIWQEDFCIRFWDVDKTDQLTLAGTFDFFQEAAIAHAEHLGVGKKVLDEKQQAWILSRMSVLIERRPRKDEKITIRTWPRGPEKLFVLRDYDLLGEDNAVIVRGRSAWLVLDMEKHRPLRPQPIVEHMPLNEGLNALPDGAQGIDAEHDLVKVYERQAAYSDIDYNGHVNNARYIQWIQDAVDPEILYDARQMRLDINYLSEVKAGETIGIWTCPVKTKSGTLALEGKNPNADISAFRAQLWTGK